MFLRRKTDQRSWDLFTSFVLLLSSSSRAASREIDVYLKTGSYDLHLVRKLNALKRALEPYAAIGDHSWRHRGDSISPEKRRARSEPPSLAVISVFEDVRE